MIKWADSSAHRQSFAISMTALACAILLMTQIALLMFVLIRGSDYFWPHTVAQLTFKESETGQTQTLYVEPQVHSPNEDKWDALYYTSALAGIGDSLALRRSQIQAQVLASDIAVLVMHDGRRIFARPLSHNPSEEYSLTLFDEAKDKVTELTDEVDALRLGPLAGLHRQLALFDEQGVDPGAPMRQRLESQYHEYVAQVDGLNNQLSLYNLKVMSGSGAEYTLDIADIDRMYFPNRLGMSGKIWLAIKMFGDFVTEPPKQANTSGGVFPAIFGTVLMVMLMTVIVTPFGVLVAVYLSEYAPRNGLTSLIRIGVSNLASVPSVVFGVFGLGFFVYTIGSGMDSLFSTQSVSSPKMGAPNLFWAALTMALLTLPVVIVATEEGLRRVPESLRKGSFALGATQSETIWHTVLPMASPGIMTGVILAIARGAGEVAPLLLVGAVKFAPSLPIDGEFPFVHLDRQFMHLGVMVYEGAFQSQTIGQGASYMFASCMLLLFIVFVLNLLAVALRSRLKRQFDATL